MMRTLFLALMIILSPLRSWVGDAMAMEPIGPALHGQQSSDAAAHDCHEQLAQCDRTPVLHDNAPADGEGDGHRCTDCQICHSMALPAPVLAHPLEPGRNRLPHRPKHLHTSAELVQSLKPPIA